MKKLFTAALVLAVAAGVNAQTVIKIASQSPLSGGQAELVAQLARQGQLAVFRYNRRHGCKLP